MLTNKFEQRGVDLGRVGRVEIVRAAREQRELGLLGRAEELDVFLLDGRAVRRVLVALFILLDTDCQKEKRR